MIASKVKNETPTQAKIWPCCSLVFEVIQVLKYREPGEAANVIGSGAAEF